MSSVRVRPTAHDARIKNKEALTMRTIERITGKSAAAPLELAVVVGLKRVLGVEKRLQELNDCMTQCAEAHQRENN